MRVLLLDDNLVLNVHDLLLVSDIFLKRLWTECDLPEKLLDLIGFPYAFNVLSDTEQAAALHLIDNDVLHKLIRDSLTIADLKVLVNKILKTLVPQEVDEYRFDIIGLGGVTLEKYFGKIVGEIGRQLPLEVHPEF